MVEDAGLRNRNGDRSKVFVLTAVIEEGEEEAYSYKYGSIVEGEVYFSVHKLN